MKRKLASIQTVRAIEPIAGADRIELARIKGWQVIIQKDEYRPGDRCVYFEIDSVLPDIPAFEFMRSKNFRVKTIKMRGVLSQGLCVRPTDVGLSGDLEDGLDVTEILGVKKFVPDDEIGTASTGMGKFPAFIPQTDEIRIQSVPELLNRHDGTAMYITEKIDGTSFTAFIFKGQFMLCSRNRQVSIDPSDNAYAKVAQKYHLAEILPEGYAIQAEMIGPKIQKNKYGMAEHDIYVFNVFRIPEQRYMDFPDAKQFVDALGLKFVPILNESRHLGIGELDVCGWETMAHGKSILNPKIFREGIVVRSVKEDLDLETGRLSFKVVDPEFLLQWKE